MLLETPRKRFDFMRCVLLSMSQVRLEIGNRVAGVSGTEAPWHVCEINMK
jgi:hypothetical protein